MKVFLLAPDFRTRGGFENQLACLASGLAHRGWQVHVFIRQPVFEGYPYWIQMRQDGVHLHSPSVPLAAWLNPSPSLRKQILSICLVLLSPILIIIAAFDAMRRRRSYARSWQGTIGEARRRISKIVYYDALTLWMEFQIDREMRRQPPDIIDVQHSMLPAGIAYAHRRGMPVIYTEYGAPSEELSHIWKGLCPVINKADFIIARSEASIAGLQRLCGLNRPFAILPNAVTGIPEESDDCKLPDTQPFNILYIGRLSPEKGPGIVLEAFKRLNDSLIQGQNPSIKLNFAGAGPLQAELELLAIQSGLQEQVTFIGAFEKIEPYLRQARIVAHPTLNDGRSVAVLEAMAWGRPVVASNTGGLPELIDNGITGFLVSPGDPADMASALLRLITDPMFCEKMGKAAREKFLRGNYTRDAMVSATTDLYQQVIASHNFVYPKLP